MHFMDTTIRTSLHYPVNYQLEPEVILMQNTIESYSPNNIVEPSVY